MTERPEPPDRRGVPCDSWIEWCLAELEKLETRLNRQPTDAAQAYARAELEELRAKAALLDCYPGIRDAKTHTLALCDASMD